MINSKKTETKPGFFLRLYINEKDPERKKLVLTQMRQWNHRKCSPQTTKGRRVKDKNRNQEQQTENSNKNGRY